MSYINAQNDKIRFGNNHDTIVKTPGGGVILRNRVGEISKSSHLNFNVASNDMIEELCLNKSFRLDKIQIKSKTFIVLVVEPLGKKTFKPSSDRSNPKYVVSLNKEEAMMCYEILNSDLHVRSPKFSLWEVSEKYTDGAFILALRPAERMLI